MKKFIIVLVCLGTAVLTACVSTPVKRAGETTAVVEDFVNPIEGVEEISNEEEQDDLLINYDRYSKEFIDEMYFNFGIEGEPGIDSEWQELETMGYSETEIKFILLQRRDYCLE